MLYAMRSFDLALRSARRGLAFREFVARACVQVQSVEFFSSRMRPNESWLKGHFPSKACNTMPSSRSPRVKSR